MWSVDIETPLIKMKEKYKPPFIIFFGLLTSTWASCVFVVSLAQYGDYRGVSKSVISTSILSFWTISVAVSFGLYWAFKQQDQFYILPWIIVKIVEMILIVISIILLAIHYYYAWLIFPAVIFLIIGSYLTHCILKTYNKVNNIWQTTIPTNIEHNKGSWTLIETPWLAVHDKLKAPLVIVGGLLISLWANCISSVGMSENSNYFRLYELSAGFGVATYILISVATTWCLIYGIQKNDPGFVRFWILNKILDICDIYLGIILIIVDSARTWHLIIVGAILSLIALYLMKVVWKLYKVMKLSQIPANNTTNNTTEQTQSTTNTTNTTHPIENNTEFNFEDPPTYEQFVNHGNRF